VLFAKKDLTIPLAKEFLNTVWWLILIVF
jgi:hypothetical protein